MKYVLRVQGFAIGIWIHESKQVLKIGGSIKAYDCAYALMHDYFEYEKFDRRHPTNSSFSFVIRKANPIHCVKIINKLKDDGFDVEVIPAMGRIWS